MIARAQEHAEFALCVANAGYDDLEVWKVYRVLADSRAIEVGCLRVIDESGEDYLSISCRSLCPDGISG